jgi:hypothetical protein
MILLAAITTNMTEMMIGVLEVAIVVILAAMKARETNPKAGQEEKNLISMNQALSMYFPPIS